MSGSEEAGSIPVTIGEAQWPSPTVPRSHVRIVPSSFMILSSNWLGLRHLTPVIWVRLPEGSLVKYGDGY